MDELIKTEVITMSRGKFIGEGRSRILDLSEIRTYDSHDRHNLVRVDNMMNVGDPHEEYTSDGFDTLVDRIVTARKNGRPVYSAWERTS